MTSVLSISFFFFFFWFDIKNKGNKGKKENRKDIKLESFCTTKEVVIKFKATHRIGYNYIRGIHTIQQTKNKK